MKFTVALTLIGVLMAGQVAAQSVYRWTDHEGQVHYGHAVPPEYRSRGFDRLAPDGRLIERVAPAMTPEERAEQAARLALQAELQAEQESQAARDRLLLAAYRSEAELIETRDARLMALKHQRDALDTSRKHSVQRFEDLVARAASLSRNAQPVPDSLDAAIRATQDEIRRLRGTLSDMDERMAEVEARFNGDLERYRSLTGQPD